MSIRLRLTLIYTVILALTLVVFGLALYVSQSQATLNALKEDLERVGTGLARSAAWAYENFGTARPPEPENRPPFSFNSLALDPGFKEPPKREIIRVLDAQGALIDSSFGQNPFSAEASAALPLSTQGLAAVRSQELWWETATVDGERLLILNAPVVVQDQVVLIVQTARPLTERDRSLQALGSTLLIASLITSLIAFGIGWLIAGVTLRPIHRIAQTAQEIGNERDFTRRVDYHGPPDEIGQLAATFNTMLARLQEAYQQVARSLEMQRSFVADVSHELRTPLTTLRGNLSLLRRTPPIPADEQADILSDIVDESDRLIRLVNDLLVLARADAGRHLKIETLDVYPILEETCRQARQLDPQRSISLEAPAGLSLRGDRDALKQVLLILLDNALKYSAGAIFVTAARLLDGQVELRVRDQSPGLSPDKLEHVFDRFYRGEEDRQVNGFGLGLPIARALVEAQAGTIAMESQLGMGSQAIVRLPAARSQADRA
jgi:signal transduction histidine kinase